MVFRLDGISCQIAIKKSTRNWMRNRGLRSPLFIKKVNVSFLKKIFFFISRVYVQC